MSLVTECFKICKCVVDMYYDCHCLNPQSVDTSATIKVVAKTSQRHYCYSLYLLSMIFGEPSYFNEKA